MIITKTPLRISFTGGGTDICDYYRHGYGAVVSAAIDKFVYITVNKKFDDSIRISYSKTEMVDDVDLIQHDIVRECLKMVGIRSGIEITSIADVPAGTGLGSSSTFAVGLLNALYTYTGYTPSAKELAEKACEIEIKLLKNPIGKQDQYAAAYGGINYFQFNSDETVDRRKISLSVNDLKRMNRKLMMFYTGITRSANTILSEQKKETDLKLPTLDFMCKQAQKMEGILRNEGFNDKMAQELHQGWLKKKSITPAISTGAINDIYETAIKAGALGGKLLGAGGGGFFLFYCDEEKQQAVRDAVKIKEMDFNIFQYGSRVVYFE